MGQVAAVIDSRTGDPMVRGSNIWDLNGKLEGPERK